MKIRPGASKVALVKKRFSLFVAILVGFVGLGLSPAFAIDERVIDVVEVTWAGAPAPAGDANKVATVIDTEVNADWKKFTTMYGDTQDRTVSFQTGEVLDTPIALVSKMACTGYLASEFMGSIRPEASLGAGADGGVACDEEQVLRNCVIVMLDKSALSAIVIGVGVYGPSY